MGKTILTMAVAIVTAIAVHAQSTENDCGFKFNTHLDGVTKIEIESVDGYPLSGSSSIVTFSNPDGSEFVPGKDYYIHTLPCDLYGGYRLSLYKDGRVADYFGVHQKIEPGSFISPSDLVESELEFKKPGTPLVEETRPKMDATTHQLFIEYRRNPTEANKQALLDQMGIRYDKVVARKKNKLRQLEREAKTKRVVDQMQGIVNEMVQNRDARIQQQFLRFVDPRRDDNPKDSWMVLRGAASQNAYIGYAPVTNAEYAEFKEEFKYDDLGDNYPVVGLTVDEVKAYCDWLSAKDPKYIYRLPTDEEWILAAGHMPKDVEMNSGHIEKGLTAVDAYKQSAGACGGVDFWGNCWEWTSSVDSYGMNIIKGGSWNSTRDDCRSEKSDVVRDGSNGYANVGFRMVRIDKIR